MSRSEGLLAFIGRGIASAANHFAANRNQRKLFEKIDPLIGRHAAQLAKRRAQLVRQDPYGKLLLDKWHSEINYFIAEHIRPSLTDKERVLLEKYRPAIYERAIMSVEAVIERTPVFHTFSNTMTPQEFESFCAEQLRSAGWDAQLTAISGDQGVDVIAEKDGTRVVLQCKRYSGTVGNSAVQEVVAGRAFERADHCAVVTNSVYTPAAEQLASANGVLLLHYSELPHLHALLRLEVTNFSKPAFFAAQAKSQEMKISSTLPNPPLEIVEGPPLESVRRLPKVRYFAVIGIFVLIAAFALLLFPRHPAAAPPFATYTNSKFGFRIDYPSSFITKSIEENGDGVTMLSSDGSASLVVAGGNNVAALKVRDYYNSVIATATGTRGYHRLGNSWFVVTWVNRQGQVVYTKMFVGTGAQNSFTFTFPESQRATYEPLVTRMEKSFRPGALQDGR